MLRPTVVLLSLLGLASSAPGQAANTSGWTIAVGEFTIYGHTDYTPTITLIPRVVFDTARGSDSTRVVDSVRATPAPPSPSGTLGFAAGMSQWPEASYCAGPTTAATQPLAPSAVLRRIQLAARCGMRLVIVPPRRFLTTTGQTSGQFSVDSAKRLMDRYAAVLPPDTLSKYRTTILGLNLGDDYSCKDCWGGEPVTQTEVAAWAAYARARLPGLPLGARVTPDWVAKSSTLAPLLDYTWAQYHTGKGDAQKYFDNAAAIAARMGLKVVMGINVHDCNGVGSSPCTAADLVRFGTLAVQHPASCAFLSWRYDEPTWNRAEIREAWTDLLALARARKAEECRRGSA
jgi:hypothetical protein